MSARWTLGLAALLLACGGRVAQGPGHDAAAGSAGVSLEGGAAGAGGADGSTSGGSSAIPKGGTAHTGGSLAEPAGGRATVPTGGSGSDVAATGGNATGGIDSGLCGNGRVDPDEICDDGNVLPGDGCSSQCQLEDPWPDCSGGPCVRMVVCGDGLVEMNEACDDGNVMSGDGCASDCAAVERGYYCPRPGARCVPLSVPGCGDGIVQPELGEECDDGFNRSLYGSCTPDCMLGPYCGDGIVQAEYGEQCDHGMANGADACSTTCLLAHLE